MSNPQKRILILDDDQQLAEMMAEYLEITCQQKVQIVLNETDFWNLYTNDSYDIIFLDYRLSDKITGIEVLKSLADHNNQVPVVMMTGEGNESIAVQAMQNGAFDYLVKGEYALNQLSGLVQKAIRFRKLQDENRISLQHIKYQSNLLDNMRDAVVVWDIEGNITYWNKTAEQLFGYKSKELLNKSVKDTYWKFFRFSTDDDFQQIIDVVERERMFINNERESIWISSQITPLMDENGQINGFMDICRDITQRKNEQQILNETRHFLERIIESSPDLVFIFDIIQSKITFITPNVVKLLGFSTTDIYTKENNIMVELVHPEDLPFINEHLNKYRNSGIPENRYVEFRIKDNQGQWHWFSSNDGIFSRNAKKEVAEIICIAQNIDEKKKTEYQLQQRLVTEKLLSSISNFFINLSAENTDIGVDKTFSLIGNFVRSDFGDIYLLDEARDFVRYCGFVKTQLKGNINPLTQEQIPWLVKHLRNQNNLQINHLNQLPKEAFKEKLFFNGFGVKALIMIPMVYNNELIGAIALYRQTAEQPWEDNHTYMLQTFAEMVSNAVIQKRSEEALRTSEMRYRAIVDEHQTELIYRTDSELNFTFVNEIYCDYYASPREELLHTSCLQPILTEDRPEFLTKIQNCTAINPVTHLEYRVYQNGKLNWQEWTIRAIYGEQDQLIEYQGVGRDITERKLMEEQLKTAQNHLAQNSRMSAIGQLASSVAHQISNPLTTIIAEAQLLTHTLVNDKENYESADLIIKAGWRAQYVIQELLMFSEPSKNTKELLDINETIQKAILLSGALLQVSGSIQLVTNLAEDLPKVHGNLQQLEDLWITMLLLAKQATSDDQAHIINIGTTPASEPFGVKINISDNGLPFTEDELEDIFEPKLIPGGIGRGSGIELSICREIVRQHKGTISVKQTEGFTTFYIFIPGELEAYGTH